MKLEDKLHEELMRYRSINRYGKKMIMEQEEPVDPTSLPGGAEAPVGDIPAGDAPAGDAPVGDIPAGPPAGEIAGGAPEGDAPEGGSPDGDTEEIDITDLVNMTQNIKNQLDDKEKSSNEVIGKMDDLFSKLDDLESKLSQMDNVIAKIDGLEAKVEIMKTPTPQEKLEMRSLDSYPFNQKPSEFFSQKQLDMKASGKNEYVITKQDVDDYNDKEMRDSFNIDPNAENEVEW
jgi:hypothetical protein